MHNTESTQNSGPAAATTHLHTYGNNMLERDGISKGAKQTIHCDTPDIGSGAIGTCRTRGICRPSRTLTATARRHDL